MKKTNAFVTLVRVFYAFLTRKTVLPYPPLRLWMEVSSKCNLRCIMCPQSEQENVGHMPLELFRKTLNEAAAYVFDVKLIMAGEPTLHPEFDSMIKYANDLGLITEMHTNATLLTKKKSQLILDSGLDVLSFSLDTLDPQKYESRRVGGKLEVTKENIKKFLELKKDGGYDKPYTIIQLLRFPGSDSKDVSEEKQVRSNYAGFPFDEVKTIKVHNIGGLLTDHLEQTGYEFNRYKPHACGDVYHALSIRWNGDVVPCCTDFLGRYVLGNVNDSSLMDIWNNERSVTLRRTLVEGGYEKIPLCSECEKACNRLPLIFPTNMLGMARSIVGRSPMIMKLENFVRKYVLLR
jgi:radical SAM protein with 4Fe4S-binding SPASM domain